MDSSFGRARAEFDIYRMDGAYDHASVASSADEFLEGMSNDDASVLSRQQVHQQPVRPTPISTDWDEDDNESVRIMANEDETFNNNIRVSFNAPQANPVEGVAAASMPMPSSSMIHFQDPKRYNDNFTSPYPTQSLRTAGSDVDLALTRVATDKTKNGRNQRGPLRKTFSQTSASSSSLAEVTPAFLRRAAQDLGVSKNQGASSVNLNSNGAEPVPPNSLVNRRDRPLMSTSSSNMMNSSIPDSSFYGADASALDGTFVSIRDLNDDDDVPSVDNDQWNSTTGKEHSDAGFPTETTSLLGRKQMPWQGGFFGSQMEKEDRRERKKMMRAREGWFPGWIWSAQSWSREKRGTHAYESKAARWEGSHPIGNDFAPHPTDFHVSGGLPRQRIFALFLIGVLCFHMALCGLHDLFLRYLSYRNPYDEDEAEVSWNGEGHYIPAYWISFDGRVLNPFVGPGARTLVAFGALVPGLVLSKGQVWRIATSLFQTSSFVQLMLHIWALKTAVGGTMIGLEWKRGTFVVASIYLITALIGSAWSIAVEPGRLITASGMGIAGLLAAASVEQSCFPIASKDDDDELGVKDHHNEHGSGSNAVSSSSNEQFSFQPPKPYKKKPRNPLRNGIPPTLILLLEILASWWAAYTSTVGTIMAAMAGAACALLVFVGNSPPGFLDRIAGQDLLLSEDTPPPPPPAPKFTARDNWRGDDDDSADTSIGSGRQTFNTPLMRRSILADEDEEEPPLGTRASVRKRKVKGSSAKVPGTRENIDYKQPFSASRVIARVIGVLLALLLTLIPASLLIQEKLSNEATRASVLGCRPMRILYKEDDNTGLFECAGGCIPLSRERIARKKEGMRVGRCDTIGYRCWQQSGTMTLQSYEVNVGIYVVPSADGSCGNEAGNDDDNDRWSKNNDDANADNGEVEGAQ